jgi:DNA-binding transcriptional regulator YhcF (GntR family)
MMLRIDPTSTQAPFAQLRDQIAAMVASGSLAAGARLPTVRRLAGDLSIAPNTVARAYRELEADGVLVGRGRAGTFVAGAAGHADRAAARDAAAAYARRARELGIHPHEALALVRLALR